MKRPSSRAIDRAAPIVAILAIAIMAAVSLKSLWPPTAPGGGPASFSAERALAHVEALAAKPRPTGSAAHRAAREYIVTALRERAGLEAEIRDAVATSTRYGVPYDAARVHNVVATIRGSDPSHRIVLVAHYDTVLTSPGAGDDALLAATLATVLVAFRVVASVRRGHSSWARLGASVLAAVAAVTLAAVACHAGWWLVRSLGAGPAPGLADPYEPVPYRFAAVLLAAGTALGVARAARQIGVTASIGLPVIAVAMLWGLVLWLPGAAYLLAVPMPFVALHAVASGGGRAEPDAMYARSWVAGMTLVRRSYAF